MEATEVAVKLKVHEHDIGALQHRVNDLELQNKAIQELTIAMNKMAVNVEHMLQEQNRQGKRLETLERVPAETGELIKRAVITALAGGAVGSIVTAIVTLMQL